MQFACRNFVRPLDGITKDTRYDAGETELVQEGDILYLIHMSFILSLRNVAKELGVAFIGHE